MLTQCLASNTPYVVRTITTRITADLGVRPQRAADLALLLAERNGAFSRLGGLTAGMPEGCISAYSIGAPESLDQSLVAGAVGQLGVAPFYEQITFGNRRYPPAAWTLSTPAFSAALLDRPLPWLDATVWLDDVSDGDVLAALKEVSHPIVLLPYLETAVERGIGRDNELVRLRQTRSRKPHELPSRFGSLPERERHFIHAWINNGVSVIG